ncbi:MAG: DUF4194 domain-containing protein [Bacilli bacterium]|nr:DUF4194 domain-containing protein [Bacilli bacterium]
MFNEDFLKMPSSDQNEFSTVVNKLLLKGFIVRDIFDTREKVIRINPDYRFLERYFEVVNDYLKYAGWNVEKDVVLGVVALTNLYGENRIRMDRETSLILFALRLIFENYKNESNSTNQAIYLTTPGLLKTMIDDGITMPGRKLNGRSIARSLRFLANHNIISKVSGNYDEGNVSFYILPSIVYALDNEKIVAMSNALDEINQRNQGEEAF